MRFFDASALMKRYVAETHSAAVRRLLREAPVATSRLSEVEVVSGLTRLAREGVISPAKRDRAVAALAADLEAWHIVELTAEVTARSRQLLVRHPLRAGDALQLAGALHLQQIARVPLTAFVAYDARLNEAASLEGLVTV